MASTAALAAVFVVALLSRGRPAQGLVELPHRARGGTAWAEHRRLQVRCGRVVAWRAPSNVLRSPSARHQALPSQIVGSAPRLLAAFQPVLTWQIRNG